MRKKIYITCSLLLLTIVSFSQYLIVSKIDYKGNHKTKTFIIDRELTF